MDELLREELLKEYGIKVRGRIDYYISSCGHVVVVYNQKRYHLDIRPTIMKLRYF
jgi:hypothetical protein